ncbi:MAG: serine/threonine-protein kinase [Gemmatimonadota bacterium]
MSLGDHAVARLRDQLVRPSLPARYEVLDVVGRGGMAVVWRVRDHVLGRVVALKVLGETVADDGIADRLTEEARILARLEHPGVVAVHDAGRLENGRTWYTMRLVVGERLDAPLARPTSLGDILRGMGRLSDTMAFAHERGIIHRDLKPANVMVGPFGELLILDWGIARALATGPLDDGIVLGTPGYMSPEQAVGGVIDERSDVYGLGTILRDLLVAWGGAVPRPVAAIRDRALARTPSERYSTSKAMGDDLRRFQDGLAVIAYRESLLERGSRVVRPYWGAIALVAAYMVMRIVVLLWKGL